MEIYVNNLYVFYFCAIGEAMGSIKGHEGGLTGISLSRNKDFIHTISFDGTARLWDPRTFK